MAILNSQIELKAPLELDIRKTPLDSIELLAKYKHMEYAYDGLEVIVLNVNGGYGCPVKFIMSSGGAHSLKKYHWKINSLIVTDKYYQLMSLSDDIVRSLSTSANPSRAFFKGLNAVVLSDENRGGRANQYRVASVDEDGFPTWEDVIASSEDEIREIAISALTDSLITEDAKESLDTLKEIARWIQDHPDDAAQMNLNIQTLSAYVSTIKDNYISEIKLDGEVVESVSGSVNIELNDYAKKEDVYWKTPVDSDDKHVVTNWKGSRMEFDLLRQRGQIDEWTKYTVVEDDGTFREYIGIDALATDSGQLVPVLDVVAEEPSSVLVSAGDRYLVGDDSTGYYIVEYVKQDSEMVGVRKKFTDSNSVRIKSKALKEYVLVDGKLKTYDDIDCGLY